MRRQATTVPQAARGSSVSCICGTLSYAQLDELTQRFEGREVLQHLLIDDDIQAAACGHWRIRAHDGEDVVINDELERAVAGRDYRGGAPSIPVARAARAGLQRRASVDSSYTVRMTRKAEPEPRSRTRRAFS